MLKKEKKFILPCMHERYLYMGGILAVLYYIVYKKNFLLTISIILCSILTYFRFLFGFDVVFGYKTILIVGYVIVIAYYTKDLLSMLRSDNK